MINFFNYYKKNKVTVFFCKNGFYKKIIKEKETPDILFNLLEKKLNSHQKIIYNHLENFTYSKKKVSDQDNQQFVYDIEKGDLPWSFSHNATRDASATMSTLIHEVGHVVQYMDETSDDRLGIRLRAKRKLTEYSGTNDREAFAEGFVAFVLQPEKLKEMRPELYNRVRKSLFEFLAK